MRFWSLLLLGLIALASTGPCAAARLTPFFDSFNNPVQLDAPFGQRLDRTPPHKRVTPFGSAVLRVCGRLGDPVSRELVHQLFENSDWGWALEPIHQKLFPELSRPDFNTRLTHIWSSANGFRTIFCGDPGPEKMVGLHYFGRFAELYQNRQAGILPPEQGADAVIPGLVYGIPMQHRWEGRWVRTGFKLYPYAMDAHDILYHVTEAALLVGDRPAKTFCRHAVELESGARFDVVIVVGPKGLLTFYPEVTPLEELKRCRDI